MTDLFASQSGPLWLANRLRQMRIEVAGIDAASVKAAIVGADVGMLIVGRKAGGGAESVEDAFERVYGQPLELAKKRRRAASRP